MTTPTTPNEGFTLREDRALKAYLQGIKVTDSNAPVGGRPVKVYYRLPEQEAMARTYPYVTIDLLSVRRDDEREHSGHWWFAADNVYKPPTRVEGQLARTEWPIPMILTYQITTFARFIQHDRQLLIAMTIDKLPPRFGSLVMVDHPEAPNDNSIRRLDLVSGPTSADAPDPADPNKRIFRKAFTVEVSSEMFTEDIANLGAIVGPNVILDLHDL